MLRLTLALMLCLAGTIVVGFTTNGDDFNNDEIDVDSQEANYLGEAEKTQRLWEQYKKLHGLTFSPSQDRKKLKVFMSTIDEIREHNLEADLGQHSYRMGLNKFAHLTKQEMDSMNGYIPTPNRRSMTVFRASKTWLPPNIDYRMVGWVTQVKDQGNCGSCYAFATTGAVEGQIKRNTDRLYRLSEQQIVDCVINKYNGSGGCNGGGVNGGFLYLMKVAGSASAATYPYEAKQGPCRFTEAMAVPGSRFKDFLYVKSGSEASLMEALDNNGPIPVSIDSSQFQKYASGIASCTSKPKVDHNALVVGYNSENGEDYWIVKNSWGKNWGLRGYIHIARNSTKYANCGITEEAYIPVLY